MEKREPYPNNHMYKITEVKSSCDLVLCYFLAESTLIAECHFDDFVREFAEEGERTEEELYETLELSLA